MKTMGGAQKLRFTVASCSGEDSDYPARELLYHSPQTRGWQSPRFCKFPQEIVLRLERPARLQQIQILAHEFKIPTKIEVYVAPPEAGAEATKRLGYLSFDSNERSGHQARELKSVHVSIDAAALRLVVHRCHVNKLNIYNQVGVVALNLIGETLAPAPQGPPPFLEVGPPPGVDAGYATRAAAEMADLNLDIHVDAVTAAKIRELARLKEAAVAAEEYDEAKRLKVAIERLKALGGKIAQLEARKRAAVDREDYDLAKALKSDINKLRSAGEGAVLADAGPPGALGGGGAGGVRGDDPVARVLGKARSAGPGALAAAAAAAGVMGAGGGGPGSGGLIGAYGGGDCGDAVDGGPAAGGALARLPSIPISPGGGAPGGPPGAEPSGWSHGGGDNEGQAASAVVRRNSGYYAYEERPAVARGAMMRPSEAGGGVPFGDADGGGLADADPSSMSAAALFGSSGGGAGQGGPSGPGAAVEAPPPAGWSRELPPPEPLAGAAAKDADVVAELSGDYVAAAFFSRNWQLRDAAIGWVTDQVRAGHASGPERRDLARAMARLAVKATKDKVPNVFSSAVGLLTALLDAMAGGGRDVASAVEQALPALIERLGDNNARLRDGARDAILSLARNRETGLRFSSGNAPLLKPVKNQTAWRPVLSTLQLLQDLVPLIGVSNGGSSGGIPRVSAGGVSSGGAAGAEGLDLNDLMDYVGRAFGSANADVRSAAVKVAVLAHDAVGPAVRRLLPRDINPKIRAQLDAALGLDAAPSPAPAPAAQTGAAGTPAAKGGRTPANGKTAAGGGGGGSAAKPSAARGSVGGGGARKPAGGKQQQQQQQHGQQQPLPPHLQHSYDAESGQAQQPPAAAGDVDAMANDPAPFEAELRSRERQYGQGHPAVAESCSNLAILYNQKGEYSRAQPLYERALRIYEATYGPDHQEVAHTLTDLAVLHLEQGHDEVGRPLLERALAIQERALGPDHPDVVAIRDVLNSE